MHFSRSASGENLVLPSVRPLDVETLQQQIDERRLVWIKTCKPWRLDIQQTHARIALEIGEYICAMHAHTAAQETITRAPVRTHQHTNRKPFVYSIDARKQLCATGWAMFMICDALLQPEHE